MKNMTSRLLVTSRGVHPIHRHWLPTLVGTLGIVACLSNSPDGEPPSDQGEDLGTGGDSAAGGHSATGGGASLGNGGASTTGSGASLGTGEAGAAGYSSINDRVNCDGWVQLQCSEATSDTLWVEIELDDEFDAILDAPVEAHCSSDVFFLWSTCVGISAQPSLLAKSSEGAAVIDLRFTRQGSLLPSGDYVDASGTRWEIEPLSGESYATVTPQNGVLQLSHKYLGRNDQGQEVEIGMHAVGCAGYYPCLK